MDTTKGLVAMMIKMIAPLLAITPEKGAETPTWIPSAPELKNETSKFYVGMKDKKDKFRDGLDELARICERMTSKTKPI